MALFSPATWRKQKVPLPTVAMCGACGLHKDCESPFMPVSGKGKKKILILAEAPGRNEDRRGIQLCGNSGDELIKMLDVVGVRMREDCWLTNSVICRPHDNANHNRTPTNDEINYCRPNLSKTLSELQPDVVITLGVMAAKSIVALAWKPGQVDKDQMARWAGWQIPSRKLNCWICPTYHTSYVLRESEKGKNAAVALVVSQHLEAAVKLKGKPWKELPNWESQCRVEMDPNKAAKSVRYLRTGVPLAIDLETRSLKPEVEGTYIICCSVSNGIESVCFPWHGAVVEEVRKLIRSNIPLISANLRMEERWFRRFLKTRARNWWHDTVLSAHHLNCHTGVSSLKFQAFVRLGCEDYSSHLDAFMKSKDEGKLNRLNEVEPAELMQYCCLDSLLEVLVARKQREEAGFGWWKP